MYKGREAGGPRIGRFSFGLGANRQPSIGRDFKSQTETIAVCLGLNQ